jgi:hypothetical protein
MTLDKHQIDGIGGFSEKVLPASQFEALMIDAGYVQIGSAPAQGGRLKFWWSHASFGNVESIYSGDKSTVITAYHS